MFQYSTIQTAMTGKVGFRQNIDSAGLQVPAGLIVGEFFVNDFHAMLTTENLKSIAPNFDAIPSIVDKSAAFGSWLSERLNASLKKLLNEWKAEKMKGMSAKTIIERQRLFRPELTELPSEITEKFVGLEILSTDSMSLAHKVERIGVQLSENQEIRVYVFRDGTRTPVNTYDIEYTGNGGVQWVTVNWALADGGKYYIGFDQNQIAGHPINGVQFHDHLAVGQVWTVGNHFSVSGFKADIAAYTGGIGSMEIQDSFVIASDNDPQIGMVWSGEKPTYTTSDNFGINLEITSFCDYTSFVVAQVDSFAYVLALRTAMDLLRELVFNPNSNINRNQANADYHKTMILYEINGDAKESGATRTGLLKDYENALSGIMFDQSAVDKVCLPCQKRGVTFRVKG